MSVTKLTELEKLDKLNKLKRITGEADSTLPDLQNKVSHLYGDAKNTETTPLYKKYSDSTAAYLNSASDAEAEEQISGSVSIAENAMKYLGTPYVWGGESMSEGGMDCSGFVYNALRDSGYNVERSTAQGYRNYGTPVSSADMQPGDLVFFGRNNNATHIGIYIGNGQMVHSAGGSKNTKDNPGKGVSVVNVNHRGDFIEARRY